MDKPKCACGCGEYTALITKTQNKYGRIKGEYSRYLPGHTAKNSFLRKKDYIINEETGCWEWQGCKSKDGYGKIERAGHYLAHRYYYSLYKGEILEGYEIDHTCHNPSCVNPDHLRLATNKGNAQNRISSSGSSKYKGVSWHKSCKKWEAYANKKYIGLFDSEEEAAQAYDKVAIELFGEFAHVNFET